MKSNLYELTDNDLCEFDKLYDGNIIEEEFYLLKAKLQLDEVLRHKFVVYKLLRREIEQDGISNSILKLRLKALDRKDKLQFKRNSILTLVLLLFIGIVLLLNKTSKNDKLYNQFKDSEVGINIPMADNTKGGLEKAMIKIANSNYKEAIIELNRCQASDTAFYYMAYCDELLGNYKVAIKKYKNLENSSSILIRNKSRFRLALLNLKLENSDADLELNAIAKDSTNQYNSLAKEIIRLSGK